MVLILLIRLRERILLAVLPRSEHSPRTFRRLYANADYVLYRIER